MNVGHFGGHLPEKVEDLDVVVQGQELGLADPEERQGEAKQDLVALVE